MGNIYIRVNGTGNAWPVPLGSNHPFYNREDQEELAVEEQVVEQEQQVQQDQLTLAVAVVAVDKELWVEQAALVSSL